MSKVEETYSKIPSDVEIDYKPIGGEVESVSDEAKSEIESVASTKAAAAIESGYGDAGDGAVLDHCRRRNLGLI